VAPKGRRDTPGRPVTWVSTPTFLDHFDLASLDDLPRIEELLQVGLLAGGAPAAEAELDGDAESTADDDAGWAEPDDGAAPAAGSP
jgi:segregation and condensation protein B